MGKLNPAVLPLVALGCGIVLSAGHTAVFVCAGIAAAVVCYVLKYYRGSAVAASLAAGAMVVWLAEVPVPEEAVFEHSRSYTGLVQGVYARGAGQLSQVDVLNARPSFRISMYSETGDLEAGDTVIFEGVLRRPNPYGDMPYMGGRGLWARANGISGGIYCTSEHILVVGRNRSLRYLPERLASGLEDAIYSSPLSAETATVLSAVLVGREKVPEGVAEAHRASGTAHLLCISGFHIGLLIILIGMALWPLKALSGGWRVIIVATGVLVWAYVFITGLQAPAVRAATMFSVFASVRLVERKASALNVLAVSAYIILLVKPLWLWSAGFQLSLSAVTAIILFSGRLTVLDARYGLLHHINKVFAVALSAAIGTAPVLAAHFHNVPLISVASNVLAVSVFPVFVCVGALCVALSCAGLPALWLSHAADGVYSLIDTISGMGTRYSAGFGGLYPGAFVLGMSAAAIIALAVLLHSEKTRTRIVAGTAAVLCLLATACGGMEGESEVYVHRGMVFEVGDGRGRIVTAVPRRSKPTEYIPYFEGNGVNWEDVRMEHARDSIIGTLHGDVPLTATRTEIPIKISLRR